MVSKTIASDFLDLGYGYFWVITTDTDAYHTTLMEPYLVRIFKADAERNRIGDELVWKWFKDYAEAIDKHMEYINVLEAVVELR